MQSEIKAPWHRRYSVGAFVADSCIRMIDPSTREAIAPFYSRLTKQLVRLRWGFTFEINDAASKSEDARFVGSVLCKIAQRGFPAPCSRSIELFLLEKAQECGLISRFREQERSGAFIFEAIGPKLRGFREMLLACFFAELLLDDEETSLLIERYMELCTPAEKEFFTFVLENCSDERIALYLVPQRLLETMVRLTQPYESMLSYGQRVDFAVELPNLDEGKEGRWIRIAIEIDDQSHKERKTADGDRDRVLQINDWEVWRIPVSQRKLWKEKAIEVVETIQTAISKPVLKAAETVRNLSPEKRSALVEMIFLPIAEAQIMAAVGRWLWSYGTVDLKVTSPQINLKSVINSINECLNNIEQLYDLPNFGRLEWVDSIDEADIAYFVLPSSQGWDLLYDTTITVLFPRPVFSEYEDTLLERSIPRPISQELVETDKAKLEKILQYFLRNITRKVRFRPGQVEIIRRALMLKPVVGLLPTAAGKSLCYQLASLLQPGFTIVVQPLRSLMWDQQDNLDALGIHRCIAIMSHGEVTQEEELRLKEEGYKAISEGFRYFVFISPERFQIPEFREKVREFVLRQPISYCVVDEAHCVSEWGHDFRPAYLNLGLLVPNLCNHNGVTPVIIALTGTASQNVLTDVMRELLIRDQNSLVVPESFDRSELSFEIYRTKSNERLGVLKSILREILNLRPGQPIEKIPCGLIFTYFVRDKTLGVENILNELLIEFPQLIEKMSIYSGSKPYSLEISSLDWEREKIRIQQLFKRGDLPIIVCTHSFGMGIDKPDIRFTIHAMLPRSLEEFYQQAGRAGRDGEQARCIILFSDDQPELSDMILDPIRTPIENALSLIKEQVPNMADRSDALRNVWFLCNNFLGKEREKEIVKYVWNFLSERLPSGIGNQRKEIIGFDFLPDEFISERGTYVSEDQRQQALEKAIYRLLIVGAIEDYAKDWTQKSFIVILTRHSMEEILSRFEEYLRRYTTEGEAKQYVSKIKSRSYKELVLSCVFQVVEFVYDRIESRRRRAMWEMLRAARDAVRTKDGKQRFRDELLRYLEESEFTPLIRELKPTEWKRWFEILQIAEGIDGLMKLQGACRRQLEEMPNHPGLLLLNGLCQVGDDTSFQQGIYDIGASLIALERNYPEINRLEIIEGLISFLQEKFPSKVDQVLAALIDSDIDHELTYYAYKTWQAYSFVYGKAFLKIVELMLKELRNTQEVIKDGATTMAARDS